MYLKRIIFVIYVEYTTLLRIFDMIIKQIRITCREPSVEAKQVFRNHKEIDIVIGLLFCVSLRFMTDIKQ